MGGVRESSEMTDARFGPEFVEQHRARHGKRPGEHRQLTYDIAEEETFASRRSWLDDQLSLLTPK